MDQISALLQEWGVQEYVSAFEENGIDIEALLLLDNESIKELIPKIGLRLKFISKLDKYKQQLQEEEQNKNFSLCLSNNSNSGSTITLLSGDSISEDLDQELLFVGDVIPASDADYVNKELFPSTSTSDINTNSKKRENEVFVIPPCKKLCKTDLKTYFTKRTEWTLVKNHFDKNNVTEYTRSKIAKVALDYLLENYSTKIPKEAFMQVAKEIEDIFPPEHKNIYFVPYKPKTETSPKIDPCGKLWSMYNNYKRQCRVSKGVESQEDPDVTSKESNDNDKETSINNNEILKYKLGPEQEILLMWSETFHIRKQFLKENDIYQYFKTYPSLSQPYGYNLLLSDFDRVFPGKKDIIYTKWSRLAKAILALAAKKDIVQESQEENTNLDRDALRYLPLLFPVSTVRSGKKCHRPSKAEVQESFILEINKFGLFQQKIDQRRKNLSKYNLTVQPFMVFINSPQNSAVYVIIDETKYLVETPLMALDVCFKATWALDAKYAIECRHVWILLQHLVYGIEDNMSKNLSSVLVVENELNNILKQIAED